jgi:tetratricopeptide (TPR) repeat protein
MSEQWRKAFSQSFSEKDGNDEILAMAAFGGELYIGAGRVGTVTSANVYRLVQNGCKHWQDVTPPWSSATGGYVMAMAVFKGYLYVGTDQGEVWRAADGESWENVTGNFQFGQINAMAAFEDDLYLCSGTRLWRTSNGSVWQLMVDLNTQDSRIFDINSLEVFKGYLYAGIGLNKPKGIQLWRTLDGKNWSKFQELVQEPGPLGFIYPEHVHALKAFNGHLYVGRYHGHGLHRTDGSAASWDYIPDAISEGSGSVFRLQEHAGRLYIGASHLAPPDAPGVPGTHLLYTSVDGTQWAPVPGSPTVGNDYTSVMSLLSHQGRLYVGTANSSQSGSVVVWELTEILADDLEPNDTMAMATSLKLGLTDTYTSTEIANLTLHNQSDVDFFQIEYQSEPQQECPKGLDQEYLSVEGGKVGEVLLVVGFTPVCLSIHAQEEYCQVLLLAFFNSQGKPVRELHTAEEVRFICPTKTFADRKLYLRISLPQGQPPTGYKLSVTFSNRSWILKPLKLRYKFWEYQPPPWPPPPYFKLFDPATRYFDLNRLITDTEKYLPQFLEDCGKVDKADLEHSLGQAAHAAGLQEDAERLYRQSLATFQEMGISAREATLWRDLGELFSGQGRAEQAIECFETATQLHERLKDASALAQDRLSLGRHYLATGEASKALAVLERALCIRPSTAPDIGRKMFTLLYQSEAFIRLKWSEPAIACLILAEGLSSRIDDSSLRQEIDRRVELLTTQVGEQGFLALKDRLASQAETIRRQAIAQIVGETSR